MNEQQPIASAVRTIAHVPDGMQPMVLAKLVEQRVEL